VLYHFFRKSYLSSEIIDLQQINDGGFQVSPRTPLWGRYLINSFISIIAFVGINLYIGHEPTGADPWL